jgi:hypothetical protein
MPGVAVICKIPTWARRIKLLKIAKLWLRRFAATRPGRRKPRLPKKIVVILSKPPRKPAAAQCLRLTLQYGYIWVNCQPFPHCNEPARTRRRRKAVALAKSLL